MKAWDLLTVEAQEKIDNTHLIRIKGGRSLYEYAACTRNEQVLLSRLQSEKSGIHQVNRYVKWDTEVELVPIKVYVAMVQHYDQQAQQVKAFCDKEDAEQFIAQSAKIMEGYNYSIWFQDKEWIVWDKKTDHNICAYWVSEVDKETVLDLL